MKSLTVSNALPKDFETVYVKLLYNQPGFLSANNGLPQLHFYLLDKEPKQVLGHIAFTREENEVVSPYKAPFGGFELASDLSNEAFLFFAAEVMRLLKENHLRFVRMHLPPKVYLPATGKVSHDLKALGFQEKSRPVHHVLHVDADSFESKITAMEKRKLKKAAALNCAFTIEKRQDYAGVYEFIKSHRTAKGHELSMSWSMLKEAIKAYPEAYIFSSLKLDGQRIAAVIMIRVSAQVLYYYIPGHDADFNSLSPMVGLLNGLYQWAQSEGIRGIDLGTSYWANQENKSLVAFKRRVGGVATTGSILRKALT